MQLNLEKFKETVNKEEVMHLATSQDDEVTVRPVSPLLFGDMTVYFYTGNQSTKYAQMKANPNVAFTIGANGCYQATGTVRFLGSVFSEENKQVNAAYRQKHQGAFEMEVPGEDMSQNEFIAIDLKTLKGWIFDDKNPEMPIGMGEVTF